MGGGAMGEMVNDMITDMAPLLLDSVKEQILGPISNLIIAKANAFLSNYTMAELIDLILNGPGGDATTSASMF
jgi:ATP-dependent protease ClpP protease subunit